MALSKFASKSIAAIAFSTVAALTLSACGSTDPVADQTPAAGESAEATTSESEAPAADGGLSGTLDGAGASSQESAMNTWRAGFQQANPDFTVNYTAVGSGAGITQFLSNQVKFAGSDEALEDEELEKSKEVCMGESAIDIPVYISPVAVIFNLPGVKTLNLSAAQIADIFNMKITKWNDPSIQEANPDVDLPDMAITTVHRADSSGTTHNFTSYLNDAAPENWPYEASKEWPVPGGESGDKTSGLVQTVNSGEGTIGYADASQAGELGTVALKVGDSYTEYTPEAAAKALDVAELAEGRSEHDLALKLDHGTTEAGVYPLILVSYLVACPKYDSEETATAVSSFIKYVISDEAQKAAAETAGSAPLSADLAKKAEAAISSISAQ